MFFKPQLISDIWDDYKYPGSKENQSFSKTGYDKFNDFEFSEKAYDFNEEKQGQALFVNNASHSENIPDSSNSNSHGTTFEGFQRAPMEHPSITKVHGDTYNNRSYDPRGRINQFVSQYKEDDCREHLDHVLRCRFCYEHLRKKLKLDDTTNSSNSLNSPFYSGNVNNLLNIALIAMGGIFVLYMVDTILSRKRG